MQYPWTGNWMYTLQRWTGGIAFVYIVWHTYTMRFTGIDLHDAASQSFAKVQAEVHNPLLFLFYVVGLVAASWHFAYGIWLFSAKWGSVPGAHAHQRRLRVCLAFFLLLSVVGSSACTPSACVSSKPSAEGHRELNHGAASLPEGRWIEMAVAPKIIVGGGLAAWLSSNCRDGRQR
jgi:succinate dehydrogenase/fumarate reductase cytochrome b subunit